MEYIIEFYRDEKYLNKEISKRKFYVVSERNKEKSKV